MTPKGHVYLSREHQNQTRLSTTSGAVVRYEYEVEATQITEAGVCDSDPAEEKTDLFFLVSMCQPWNSSREHRGSGLDLWMLVMGRSGYS
jgi:hypothetical protein